MSGHQILRIGKQNQTKEKKKENAEFAFVTVSCNNLRPSFAILSLSFELNQVIAFVTIGIKTEIQSEFNT